MNDFDEGFNVNISFDCNKSIKFTYKNKLRNMIFNLSVHMQHNLWLIFYIQVWADHADLISTQYSGTGALKTDFTRTGKRSHLGLLRDGINSLTRYYKNNFSDGFRQVSKHDYYETCDRGFYNL